MKTRTEVEERFLSKVRKGEGCWEWIGYITENGYGRFYDGEHTTGAHRKSWEIHNGPIPAGIFVCHSCDNRRCVRPGHLFLGTHQDNMDDGRAKGRFRPGPGSPVKAICKHGHPRTPENLYVYPKSGNAECRTCKRERRRAT